MISAEELLAWCKAEDAESDTLEKLELAAVALVSEQTGVYWGAEDEITDTITWRGGPIELSTEPTGPVALEQWNGSAWDAVDTSTLLVQGRFIYGHSGTYSRTAPIRLRATYDAGYEATENEWDAPEPIKQAVRMLVSLMNEFREGAADDTSSFEDGLRAINLFLAPYKRTVV